MCGYCMEQLAFECLEEERSGKKATKPSASPSQYLQATGDVPAALKRLVAAAGRRKVVPISMVDDEVLICRALELLLACGFESSSYRQLLGNRLFQHALARGCAPKRQPYPPGGLPMGHLNVLYDMETFTTRNGAASLRNIARLKRDCQNLLSWYIGWWLRGGNVRHDQSVVDIDEGGSFRAAFRALFFSLLFLGRFRGARPILLKIVTTPPARGPDFDGLDLWLQRLAALCLYDLFRIEPFLDNLHRIRASLIYHIDLTRGVGPQEKADILRIVLERPEADKTDDYFSLTEWLT